ncbi:MAG: glycoside hydrolase family 15 protein [Planctomycetota bacterium]|jgi:glucoamylase
MATDNKAHLEPMPKSFGCASDGERLLEWAHQRLMKNVSPHDGHPGAVIASPSKAEPDYYYFWLRDGALVLKTIQQRLDLARAAGDKPACRKVLDDFIRFSIICQQVCTSTGLGEPKFHVDGSVFTGEWGRPQSDGPALRAITLIPVAHRRLDQGASADDLRDLYVGDLPADSVIKADLEYVSHHWWAPCFDLWEEVCAQHFYTRMTQRRALLDGAALAQRLNDPRAAAWYRQQAALIGAELELHWDRDAGYLRASIERVGGLDYKESGLDTAVILGALHAEVPGLSFSVIDDYLLATALRVTREFGRIYEININKGDRPGVAIGRYPEDRYNGYRTDAQGHAWVLATNAFAEYSYRVAKALRNQGEIRLTATNLPFFAALLTEQEAAALSIGGRLRGGEDLFETVLKNLCHEGDDFIRRTLAHATAGSLSEQIHRDTGEMTGAPDLTWSYASLITALLHRPASAPYSRCGSSRPGPAM